MQRHFALCICGSNSDQTTDIQPQKVYEVLPDGEAKSVGMIGIVDDSSEDYLYPLYCFLILLIKRLNNAMILYSKLSLLVCALLFSVMQVKAQSWQQAVKEIKERVTNTSDKKSKFERVMEEERERAMSSEENITWEVIREIGELEYTPEKGIPTQRYLTDEEKLSAYKKEIAEKSDAKKRAFLDFVQALLQKFDLVKDFPKVDWEKGFTPPVQPTGDKQKDKILQDARKFNDSVYVFGHITQSLLIDKSNEEGKKNAFYNFYQTIVARKARKQKVSAIRETYHAQALELQKAFEFIPAKPEEADKNFVAEFFSDLTWIQTLAGQLADAQKSIKISYGLVYDQDSDLRRKVEINLAHLAMLNQEFAVADSLYLVHALIPISEGNSIGVMWADVIEDNFNAMKDLFIPIPHSDSILAVIQKKRVNEIFTIKDTNYTQNHWVTPMVARYSWLEEKELVVKISPNGAIVAIRPCKLSSECEFFTLYNAHTGAIIKKNSCSDCKKIEDAQFSPNSRFFTWVEVNKESKQATIRGYDIIDNRVSVMANFQLPNSFLSYPFQFAFHPEGKFIAIGDFKEIALFDIQTSKQMSIMKYSNNPYPMGSESDRSRWSKSHYRSFTNSLIFSNDGKLFHLSRFESELQVYQIKEIQNMLGKTSYDIVPTKKYSNVIDVVSNGIVVLNDNGVIAVSMTDSSGSLTPILRSPFSSFDPQDEFHKSLRDSIASTEFIAIFPDGRHYIRGQESGGRHTYIQNLPTTLEFIAEKLITKEKGVIEQYNKSLVNRLAIFKNNIADLRRNFIEKKYAKDSDSCLKFFRDLQMFPEYLSDFKRSLKSMQANPYDRTDVKLLSNVISESDEAASQISKQLPQMLATVKSKLNEFDKLTERKIQEVGSLLRKAEIAEEEYKLKKGLVVTEKEFRKLLKIGSRCSKEIILQVKGDAVLVQSVNGDASNAKWYNFNEIKVFC